MKYYPNQLPTNIKPEYWTSLDFEEALCKLVENGKEKRGEYKKCRNSRQK